MGLGAQNTRRFIW